MSFRSLVACLLSLRLVGAIAITDRHALRSIIEPLLDPAIDQNSDDYYIGYEGADYDTPWAKYYNDTPITLNPDFLAGLAASPVPPEQALPFEGAGAALSQPGYLPVENGYTILDDGTLFLAIQSFVPDNFTGEQYDFFFSWHINDTTKYKLWNPGQHQYAAVVSDQIAEDASKTSYRERYWNVTSYVDEWIGTTAYKLSIGFFDPTLMGFELENSETGVETIVTAFVTVASYDELSPSQMAQGGFNGLNVVLAHQVRARADGGPGKEIRSRFWFGSTLVTGMKLIMNPLDLGHDLSVHCANEMTHLGSFLPALFEEFQDNIPTGS